MKNIIKAHKFFVRESRTFVSPSFRKYLIYPFAYLWFMYHAIRKP